MRTPRAASARAAIPAFTLAVSLVAPGCVFDAIDDGEAPDLHGPATPDLRRSDARPSGDLAASDLGARDLAAPTDLATPADLAAPTDLASGPRDFAGVDLAGCNGGYLNSDAPNACPLTCSAAVESVPDEGAFHIPFCTPISHVHNPPASGNHWPWPAPWGIHKMLPREWWVHNAEHQGIVLLYNCPYPPSDAGEKTVQIEGVESCVNDGGFTYPQTAPLVDDCQAEIAQLSAFYNNQKPDNWYDMFSEVRIVVTQDPLLPSRFAAVAWDWVLPMNQLDLAAIQCFIDARYGNGPEHAP